VVSTAFLFSFMQVLHQFFKAYSKVGKTVMPVKLWDLFTKALAMAFLAYWLHLGQGLNDWLGSQGFHIASPATALFAPLSPPWPLILWWITLAGNLLMLSRRTVALGCLMAGSGFFYATMCDPASIGALNMHFLFAFTVVFWSTGLRKIKNVMMSAWPTYLIRVYLVVVYFGSGWRKVIYGDWLSNPDALLHCMTGFYTTNLTRLLYPVMPLFTWTLTQYAAVAFELGAPLLLLYPPLRKWGVIYGCLLHIGIALLMKDLFYFSFQMLTFYIPVLIPVAHLDAASSKSGHQSAI
jgi:hypothetical protein